MKYTNDKLLFQNDEITWLTRGSMVDDPKQSTWMHLKISREQRESNTFDSVRFPPARLIRVAFYQIVYIQFNTFRSDCSDQIESHAIQIQSQKIRGHRVLLIFFKF